MDNLDQVSDTLVFCTVVEKGSFTAAAESLNLSKGGVSKFVNRLETRLGVRLLNRTTRRLSPTEAGEAFYYRASSALAELGNAEKEVSSQAGQPRGHLRISVPTFYGAEILSRHLRAFHEEYPDISMELALENRFVDLVQERFDLALRISAPKDSSLVMRKLAEIPMVVCASPRYLEHYGWPRTPEELRNHECLIYTVARRPNEWDFIRKDGTRYSVNVSGKFKMNDDHVGRQAALDGLGILLIPKLFLTSALNQGHLVQLFPDQVMHTATLALVYPSRRELPAKVRVFVEFMLRTAGHA